MNKSPIVTIGLPVYNSERYIEQSIRSLLSQTYSEFILFISDNASTDGTSEICRRYANSDHRIQYHRNATNIGLPRNFNLIYEHTATPYLMWSTSDDYWAPTFLERAVQVMESDPTVALCYPRAVLVDSEGKNPQAYDDVLHLVQDEPVERFMAVICNIKLSHQLLSLIRMSHLRQTHLLGVQVASEINLLAELSLYGKFVELPERLFFRRFHEDATSWKRDDPAHQARRYHGCGRKGLVHFPAWRSQFGFLAAVRRAPLPLNCKLRLYRKLLRRMMWQRQVLRQELMTYLAPEFRRRRFWPH